MSGVWWCPAMLNSTGVAYARCTAEVEHARLCEQDAGGGAEVERHRWPAQHRAGVGAGLDDPQRIDPPDDLPDLRRVVTLRETLGALPGYALLISISWTPGGTFSLGDRVTIHTSWASIRNAGRSARQRDQGEGQPARLDLVVDGWEREPDLWLLGTPGPPPTPLPSWREALGRCASTNATAESSGAATRHPP